MAKICILLFIVMTMTGCATTWKNSYGEVMPQNVEFDCKQKCGYYSNNSVNVFMLAHCMADCQNSYGYYPVREK